MSNKIDDLLNAMKLGELIHRKDPRKKEDVLLCVF